MQELKKNEDDFLTRITKIVKDNISDENFGVSELADKIGMSRSNLLRKIKKINNLSVSQFIRQIRLEESMYLLTNEEINISQASYKVGFSSTSYYIKCFREHYGYPPGEISQNNLNTESIEPQERTPKRPIYKRVIILTTAIILLSIVLVIWIRPFKKSKSIKKSIAVLPFKNDSSDTTNVYIINGLMVSLLNDLQKIQNLRILSRTSVERYRNSSKSITEIAQELGVDYIIEGSGQKEELQLLLNINLIEAKEDKQLWGKQYDSHAKEIFKVQKDIAQNICSEIKVIIMPEEIKRINKTPTKNLIAYDYFLKALEISYKGGETDLLSAIELYKKAIEHDGRFARAYAGISICYYYIETYSRDREYSDKITKYADKALLLDPQLAQSLIAKALSFIANNEKSEAIPYLEKAHEYNPNSAFVINMLSNFYTSHIPNTEKYLEYALKGVQLDILTHDSITASFIYLHVSNALIQTGFVDESLNYIDKSLSFNQKNIYSNYLKAYIMYAKNRDLKQTEKILLKTLAMDSTRIDVLQEVGKIYYMQRDYPRAYKYYSRFLKSKELLKMDIYGSENGKIAYVLEKMGHKEQSQKILKELKEYAENDNSIYNNLSLSMYYTNIGESKLAVENLELFSQKENFFYWIILFMDKEPLVEELKDMKEFKRIFRTIENKFWKNHKRLKQKLKKENLI